MKPLLFGVGGVMAGVLLFFALFALAEENSTNVTDNSTPQEIAATGTQQEISVTESPPVENEVTTVTTTEIIPPQQEPVEDIYSAKLTKETKDLLKQAKKNDEYNLLIKHKYSFDKTKLRDYSPRELNRKTTAFHATVQDVEALLADENVELVEINQEVHFQADNVPWNIAQTRADTVWNQSTGQGIAVAILDTGIAQHNDLTIAGGWNVLTNNSDYGDAVGHGTMVAGVLSATINQQGIIGVSPGVSLYAVKITNQSTGQLSDAIAGIQWAIDNNMRIVVMSFGIDSYSQILRDTLQEAYNNNMLLVAASGNNNGPVLYPAAYSVVIGVGATDQNNQRATFSNYGPELELVAPGVTINTTTADGNYAIGQGTSLAAPHVAGVAALIWAHNNSLTNAQVRAKLDNDALDIGILGKDDEYGYGLVQANLTSSDLTPINNSYFYEIYNITDYGQANQTIIFWLNGTGSIDDITFSTGYYIVTKYIQIPVNMTLHVDEDGNINILSIGLTVNDAYSIDGTVSDFITWTGNSFSVQYFDGGSPTADVVCYDPDYQYGQNYAKCYAIGYAALLACEALDSTLTNSCNAGVCDYTSLSHTYTTYYVPSYLISSETTKTLRTVTYNNCASGTLTYYQESDHYYAVDQKKTVCSGSSNFYVQGKYGASSWINIKAYACNTGNQCDSSIAGSYASSSQSYDFKSTTNQYYPCRQPDGASCNTGDSDYSNDCLTGHICSGGTCASPTNATTDLAIVNIIPIQVIPNVDMIKGKTGYIVVNVTNRGNLSAKAYVRAWFNGNELNLSAKPFVFTNTNNRTIQSGNNPLVGEWFVFDFFPGEPATNAVINATVEVFS